jgi:outer membrane protein OmpA-like peptidoglycan-associated protein
MILAQAEEACPEGADCPPAGETAPSEEAAPTAEEPAADAPAATDTPATEQPAAEATEEPAAGQGNRRQRALERARRQQEELQQQTEQPAAEQAPAAADTPATQEAPATEAPAAEAPAAEAPAEAPAATETTQDPAAADTAPAAQEPATAGEAPAGETRQQRRARLRAERQRQQDGAAQEQPAAGTETGQPAAQPEAGQPATDAGAPAAAEGESTVEQQLEAQGDTEEANRVRELRRKLRQERANADGEAPAAEAGAEAEPAQRAADTDRAERRRERREERGGRVVEERGDRIIIDLGGGNLVVERAYPDEGERLLYGARDVRVEELQGGVTRTVVFRENGSQIITERTSYGDIIRRVRVTPNGREVVLIDNRIPVVVEGAPPVVYQPLELAPVVVEIPQERYIVDLGQASQEVVQETLLAPPVQKLERQYTLQEVTQNESLRAYVPRIDLDTITFAFGSATIATDQMQSLENLGTAMEAVLAENPDEVYLIEGHTDAVGSDEDNLILSDQRAEAVAVALSQNFEIPPENLVTEGYGEQYLKVESEGEQRENRRVTVRRITPLLSAEAQQ